MQEGQRNNSINCVNFYIVFHSNYGSILLSFRDITKGQTTDGWIDIDKQHTCGP